MSWEVVVTVAKAAADYVMEEQKESKRASDLSKSLTRLKSNIIDETRKVIKTAFLEEDIKDARNYIERAENKLGLTNPTTDDLEEARDLCQRARAELNDRDIAVIAHPYYIAATTLQITVEELLGNKEDAIKTARSGAGHLNSLWEDAEKGIDTRFKFMTKTEIRGVFGRRGFSRYTYELDGVRQMKYSLFWGEVERKMKKHKAELKIDILRILRRTSNLWLFYSFKLNKLFDANIRASNGFYLTFSPRSYRIYANEDNPDKKYTKFEVFSNKDKSTYSIISYSGGSIGVKDMDEIFVNAQYYSKRMRFLYEEVSGGTTLKSFYLERYLNIAKKHENPKWALECRDTSQTNSTKFDFVRL